MRIVSWHRHFRKTSIYHRDKYYCDKNRRIVDINSTLYCATGIFLSKETWMELSYIGLKKCVLHNYWYNIERSFILYIHDIRHITNTVYCILNLHQQKKNPLFITACLSLKFKCWLWNFKTRYTFIPKSKCIKQLMCTQNRKKCVQTCGLAD